MNELSQAWAAIAETAGAAEELVRELEEARRRLLHQPPSTELRGIETLAREIREDAFAESLKTI